MASPGCRLPRSTGRRCRRSRGSRSRTRADRSPPRGRRRWTIDLRRSRIRHRGRSTRRRRSRSGWPRRRDPLRQLTDNAAMSAAVTGVGGASESLHELGDLEAPGVEVLLQGPLGVGPLGLTYSPIRVDGVDLAVILARHRSRDSTPRGSGDGYRKPTAGRRRAQPLALRAADTSPAPRLHPVREVLDPTPSRAVYPSPRCATRRRRCDAKSGSRRRSPHARRCGR